MLSDGAEWQDARESASRSPIRRAPERFDLALRSLDVVDGPATAYRTTRESSDANERVSRMSSRRISDGAGGTTRRDQSFIPAGWLISTCWTGPFE
jgi:hypothetical protein